MFLAGVAVVRCWRRPETRFFAALAAVGLLLAFGGYDPLWYALYHVVPGIKLFRVPARWLFTYTFGMACLAAIGLQSLGAVRAAAGGARAAILPLLTPPGRGCFQGTATTRSVRPTTERTACHEGRSPSLFHLSSPLKGCLIWRTPSAQRRQRR